MSVRFFYPRADAFLGTLVAIVNRTQYDPTTFNHTLDTQLMSFCQHTLTVTSQGHGFASAVSYKKAESYYSHFDEFSSQNIVSGHVEKNQRRKNHSQEPLLE